MRNKSMIRKLLIIIGLSVFVTGCQATHIKQELPKADIVYQTIIEKKDVLGFYSFDNKENVIVDIGSPLQTPMYLGGDYLVGSRKLGNPGSYHDFLGQIEIRSRDDSSFVCLSKSTGYNVSVNNMELSYSDVYNIIALDEKCNVTGIILSKEIISDAYKNSHITSYSLAKNNDFVIIALLSTEYRIYRIDLHTHKIEFFDIGNNPSLSPDDSKFVYLKSDGFYIWDLANNQNRLIINYQNSSDDDSSLTSRGILPKPMWSNDGKVLLYHKCITGPGGSCWKNSEYEIFTYDISQNKETSIINGGVYPYWIR
jgi:hypothetical protein